MHVRERLEDATWLGWKTEEGVTSQECRRLSGQENGFSPGTSEGTQPHDTPVSAQQDLFQMSEFVVICYSPDEQLLGPLVVAVV